MNKKNELVSIISPCYNGEKYLSQFLDSILTQTYRPIELIFIDDGSTDNTKDIVMQYKNLFEKSEINLRYYYKENGGQASAVNLGLKLFGGTYMMWCDSDDILMPENIERKIRFLEEHDDCGFVFCKGMAVYDNALDEPIWYLQRFSKNNNTLFSDLVFEKDIIYVPATIMVRSEAIKTAIPDLNIYEGRQGQNWQLMLPLAYLYKSGYIDEVLFKYVVHSDSHSHARRSYSEQNQRADEFNCLIMETIKKIPDISEAEIKEWEKRLHAKYTRVKLRNAFESNRFGDALKFRRQLKTLDKLKYTDYLLLYKLRKSLDGRL